MITMHPGSRVESRDSGRQEQRTVCVHEVCLYEVFWLDADSSLYFTAPIHLVVPTLRLIRPEYFSSAIWLEIIGLITEKSKLLKEPCYLIRNLSDTEIDQWRTEVKCKSKTDEKFLQKIDATAFGTDGMIRKLSRM